MLNMDEYSQTPKEELIKLLQSFMPEVFDEGKIDWEKLRATLGEDINFSNEGLVPNRAVRSYSTRKRYYCFNNDKIALMPKSPQKLTIEYVITENLQRTIALVIRPFLRQLPES